MVGRLVQFEGYGGELSPAQWMALRFFSRANSFSRTPSAFAEFQATTRGTASQAIKASLRFLGRKVYVAAIVVLIAILQHGVSDGRLKRLAQVVSVDRRTITRWRGWWRKVFTATRFWAAARAGFMPPIDEAQLPGAPIERLAGDAQDRLIGLLRFLSPVTGGAGMRAF